MHEVRAVVVKAKNEPATLETVLVPDPGTTWEIPLDQVFGRGGAVKSARYGDTLPSRDLPMIASAAGATR